MREFQARKKQQASMNRILGSKWFLLLCLILIAFLVRGNIRIFKNYFHVKEKYNTDLQAHEELKKRDEQLNKDMNRLQTEAGMDYEIRKKLDVSKEDEKVIKIIEKN